MWKLFLITTTALYLLCLSFVVSTMVSEAEVDLDRVEVKLTSIEELMSSVNQTLTSITEDTKQLRESVERMTGGATDGEN